MSRLVGGVLVIAAVALGSLAVAYAFSTWAWWPPIVTALTVAASITWQIRNPPRSAP